MRRTKIVCTLGPASRSPEKLEALILAGMDVARLNFSHGTREEHGEVIRLIRTLSTRLGKPVAVLQDLAGPKIRVGAVEGGKVELESGRELVLTSGKTEGDRYRIPLGYKGLTEDVKPGDELLLADGAIDLEVLSVSGRDIRCRVEIGGELSSHKGINATSASIHAPILSEKDKEDLRFGMASGVDYVAISFVRNVKDVQTVLRFMAKAGSRIPLIAKIEKHEAISEIDGIMACVDGIMVARGDMGVEIPQEHVPRIQKMLIRKANQAGKPVITATQMLKSMVDNPRPTRAEVNDVANAVLDGSDGVMLSEESAVGRYPDKAVDMMSRICLSTEEIFPYRNWHLNLGEEECISAQEALACSACRISRQIHASAIVTYTLSGSTTRLVSKYKPSQPVIALTPLEETYRRLSLVWGARPVMAEPASSTEEIESQAVRLALRTGMVKRGQKIVVTAGFPLYVPGTTNLIRIMDVP